MKKIIILFSVVLILTMAFIACNGDNVGEGVTSDDLYTEEISESESEEEISNVETDEPGTDDTTALDTAAQTTEPITTDAVTTDAVTTEAVTTEAATTEAVTTAPSGGGSSSSGGIPSGGGSVGGGTNIPTDPCANGHDFDENGECKNCDAWHSVGLKFFSKGDGTCSVSGRGNCQDTEIIIPEKSSANDLVIGIGYGAFESFIGLTSIEIPEGVTSIGSFAFSGCRGLTEIEIPASVTSIHDSAFLGCSNLKSVTFEKNSVLTNIADSAFSGCKELTSIKIPEGVTTIGENAFSGCRGLTSIEIPASVTSIHGSAFLDCIGLNSITFEKNSSLTSIGNRAFYGCSGLEGVELPENVTSIGAEAFSGCRGLTSIEIPASVTSIYGSAFLNCIGLNSITFEKNSSLTSIGNRAFYGCSGLGGVELPENVTSIGAEAFSNCSGLVSVEIPKGVTSIGGKIFSFCSNLESITVENGNTKYHSAGNCVIETETKTLIAGCKNSIIPTDGSVTTIGEYAFYSCSGLSSIEIPSSITSIGDSAFYGCSDLSSIEIPKSVTSIAENAFYGCQGLTSVIFEKGSELTIIGERAFSRCGAITGIEIPNSVTSIGKYGLSSCKSVTFEENSKLARIGVFVFSGNGRLVSIEIPKSVKDIDNFAFENCKGLKSITFEENSELESIASSAFYGCSGLETITLPESVTSIGFEAFSGCKALADIKIPKGVTSIEYNTFLDCSSLQSIDIPEGLTSIANDAFRNCSGLKTVKLPESITHIGGSAFSGCSGLEAIELPKNVTSIGNGAFYACGGLESIAVGSGNTKYHSEGNCLIETETKTLILGCKNSIIPADGSVTSIGEAAFYKCSELESIVIPKSVTSMGNSAFDYCIGLETINYTGTEEQWKALTKNGNWAHNTGYGTAKGTYTVVYNYTACIDGHDFDENGKCLDCGIEKWTLPSGINTYYAYNTSANAPTIDGEIKTGEYGTATRVSSPRATTGDDINTKWATAEYDATLASEYIDYYFAFDEENVYIAFYELGPELIDNGDSYTQNDVAFRNNHFFQLGFDPSDATSYLYFGGYTTNNIWKNLKYSKNGSLYTAPFGTPELVCESVVKTVDVASGKTVGIGDLVSTSGIVNNPSGQWAVTVEFKLSKADIISVINELYGTNYTSLSDAMWIGMTANAFRAKADNLNDTDNQRFRWLGINDITGKQGDYTPYGFSSSSTADHMLDVVVFADKDTQLYKANSDPCSDGHLLVNYAAKAPTESTIGWDAYVSCDRCSYTTYKELPMLSTAFKTGYARCTFTPTPPIGQFSTVHDDLYATCVAVNDGEKTLLLLSIDMKSMSINDNDNIKSIISNSTGIPTGNIFISATHTHSTITFGKDAIWAYNSFKKIEQVAKNAIADLTESEMLAGTGKTTGMAWVRNYINSDGVRATVSPGALFSDTTTRSVGEADDTLQAVRFVRDGKKDIVLLNWQGHLAHGEGQIAGQISADMAQYLREDIESGDRDTLVAFFAGASGNLNLNAPNKTLVKYSNGVTNNNHYEVVAHALAKVALAVIEPDEMTSLETGEIKIIKEVYAGLLHKDSPEVVAEAQARKDAGTNTKADDYILARNKKTSLDLRIAAISFGDLGLVTVPYEMFDNNGVQVKEGSPFKMTFVLTNSDGDYAYMPSTEAWTTYGGYETEATYFANGTAEAYVAEYIRLLNSLKNS